MLQTMSKNQFIDAFKQNDERRNNYSYEALDALYDYLDEIDHCTDYLFDLVAICCEWTEYDSIEELEESLADELELNAVIIPFKRPMPLTKYLDDSETFTLGYLVQNH